MNFYDRLKALIKKENRKIGGFEAEMGFSNGSLSKALEQKRGIGSDRLETIFSKYPLWSAEWLLKGRGEMYVSANAEKKEGAEQDVMIIDLRKTIAAMEKVIHLNEQKNIELNNKVKEMEKKIQQYRAHQKK